MVMGMSFGDIARVFGHFHYGSSSGDEHVPFLETGKNLHTPAIAASRLHAVLEVGVIMDAGIYVERALLLGKGLHGH